MLPDRSKRFALTETGELPRLRLAEGWQLAVIACIMAGLFVVIFPRQALVDQLYHQEVIDDLTLSYVDNLQRTDPGNADLAILRVRARPEQHDLNALLKLLQPALASQDGQRRMMALHLLLDAAERTLKSSPDKTAAEPVRARMQGWLHEMQKEGGSEGRTGDLVRQAFFIGLPMLALDFMRQMAPPGDTQAARQMAREALVVQARAALGRMQHEQAADYYLLASQYAADEEMSRQLLIQGVDVLMAASRFERAMQVADEHLGVQAGEHDLLRYLIRTALAAGYPQRAADYARRLVFEAAMPSQGAAR
jgi:hypothetical protein